MSTAPAIATFQYPRQVRLVDTDATGFAHFSSYLRMMEETEYAFLRSRGLCVVLYDTRGTIGFPRISANVNIHQPLVADQQVSVRLKLVAIDGKQVQYDFEIRDDLDTVAVEGCFIAACCRFPDREPPYAILIPEFISDALTTAPKKSTAAESPSPQTH